MTDDEDMLGNKQKRTELEVSTDSRTEIVPASIAGLTPRQERFAVALAECGVAIDAYAAIYDCEGSSRATVRVNAHRLARNPKVAARVRQLLDAVAAHSVRDTVALIAELEEMVDADPNELVRLDVGCCRHCWGQHGQPQWYDEMDWARACDAAIADRRPLPSMAGSFGYEPSREPSPDCRECGGQGIPRVVFGSTADASRGARRLLRGVELFPNGSVKRVLLHDQTQLRIELHKLRGMHVDRSVSLTAHVSVPALKDMTAEQALDFLESLRPTTRAPDAAREPVTVDAEL